jgi:N-methylhydantoinase B
LQGGGEGEAGKDFIIRDGRARRIGSKGSWELEAGDRVRIETPGGGGFGSGVGKQKANAAKGRNRKKEGR